MEVPKDSPWRPGPWDEVTPASVGTVLAVESDPFPSERSSVAYECVACGMDLGSCLDRGECATTSSVRRVAT